MRQTLDSNINGKKNTSGPVERLAEKVLDAQIERELRKPENKKIIHQVREKVEHVINGPDEMERRRWNHKLEEFGLGSLRDLLGSLIFISNNPSGVASHLGLKKATQVVKNLKSLMSFAGIEQGK